MPSKNYNVEACEFGQVLEVWQSQLWPDRQSPIEKFSCIDENGEIDSSLKFAEPLFWRILNEQGQTLGVLSGIQTCSESFRSRGLWVHKNFRRSGLGKALMNKVMLEAKARGLKRVWSMPRQSAWPIYQSWGFCIQKEILKYEFGPHYIATRSV